MSDFEDLEGVEDDDYVYESATEVNDNGGDNSEGDDKVTHIC